MLIAPLHYRFRQARLRRGVTQQMLADQVGKGSGGHISEFESGHRDLRIRTLEQLADGMDYRLLLVPNEHLEALTRYLARLQQRPGAHHDEATDPLP